VKFGSGKEDTNCRWLASLTAMFQRLLANAVLFPLIGWHWRPCIYREGGVDAGFDEPLSTQEVLDIVAPFFG
jgi:hypothetical protein